MIAADFNWMESLPLHNFRRLLFHPFPEVAIQILLPLFGDRFPCSALLPEAHAKTAEGVLAAVFLFDAHDHRRRGFQRNWLFERKDRVPMLAQILRSGDRPTRIVFAVKSAFR